MRGLQKLQKTTEHLREKEHPGDQALATLGLVKRSHLQPAMGTTLVAAAAVAAAAEVLKPVHLEILLWKMALHGLSRNLLTPWPAQWWFEVL